MTSNGLLRIAIKLIGLAMLITGGVEAAQNIPMAMGLDEELIPGGYAPSFVVAYLMPVLLGLLLWLAPSAVANTIIKEALTTEKNVHVLNEIELIAIRVLGLYFLYQALSAMLYTYLSYRQELSFQLDAPGYELTFIVTAFELILSICLILGAKGFQNLIRKIRYAS